MLSYSSKKIQQLPENKFNQKWIRHYIKSQRNEKNSKFNKWSNKQLWI